MALLDWNGVTGLFSVPFGLKLGTGSDTGVLGDGLTSALNLSILGEGAAGSPITIAYDGPNGAHGTFNATIGAGGAWWADTGFLTEGSYLFTAFAGFDTGPQGTPSQPMSVTIDRTAPTTPLITTAAGYTRLTTPILKGTAEKNSVVSIYVDGAASPLAQATTDAYGNWTIRLPKLPDGPHTFAASATDAAGNASALSAAIPIIIDHVPPPVPVLQSTGFASTGAAMLSGVAEANAKVLVYLTEFKTNPIGAVLADASGRWSYTIPFAMADAQHAFALRAADAAGNTSAPVSGMLDFTTATPSFSIIPPAALAPLSIAAPVFWDFAALATSATNPVIRGGAPANSTVSVYVDGTTKLLGVTTADSTGRWSLQSPVALADGRHGFVATAKDALGHVSTFSNLKYIEIDHTAPLAPSVAPFSATLINTVPMLKGMAEANATVAVYMDGATSPFAKIKADASGAWSAVAPSGIVDGLHRFTARATDLVGNVGTLSLAASVTVDRKAPAIPTLSAFPSTLTNDDTPTLSGKAEAGSTVTVLMDAASLAVGHAVANSLGAWSLTLGSVADGTHSFWVTAADAAGNVSTPSLAQTLTIDTQAPAALVTGIKVAGDNVIDATEAAAATAHITGTLSQTMAAGDVLVLTVNGVNQAVAAANITGTTFAVDIAKPAGGWTNGVVIAHLEDAAHNAGASFTNSYTVGGVLAPSAANEFKLGINISGGEYGSGGTYGFNYIYPSAKQIDYYASKGLEVIRMPFDWDRLQKTAYGVLDPVELGRIDAVVNYATSKGLQIVLDPHTFGYGPGGMIGSAASPNSMFADFWGKVADHYKSNPNVVFGLMNEPHDQTALSWLGSVNAALSAIRATGATNEVLVPGTFWDGAWTWTTSDNSKVLAPGVIDPGHHYTFEVHQYLDTWSSGTETTVVSEDIGWQRLTAITDWAKQTGNKLFLGEFGVSQDATSLKALDKMITYMQQHSDVWEAATYWCGGAWSASYAFSAEPIAGVDKPQLLILQQHATQVV
jgi:endoglucanase